MKTALIYRYLLIGFCLAAINARGQDGTWVEGRLDGQILTAGSRRVMILSPAGQVLWERQTGLTHDVWMLPGGNILYADEATVTEVTRDQKVVFQYRPAPNKGGGAFSCQRLENGNTLVGENSTGKVLEVDRQGKVVFSLQTSPFTPGDHQNMRMARKLKNGNYLVCQSGAARVKEYTPRGEVVLDLKVDKLAFSAIRTPAGTTLVSCLDKIVELDARGQAVWQFANTGIPGVAITNMTGMQLLPSGNLAVGCYQAYDKASGRGTGLFEITREKKLVWRYANPKGDGTMMPLERLDKDGKALPGECLR